MPIEYRQQRIVEEEAAEQKQKGETLRGQPGQCHGITSKASVTAEILLPDVMSAALGTKKKRPSCEGRFSVMARRQAFCLS
jgi:hypothetical protein